jgi:hypothetical protein
MRKSNFFIYCLLCTLLFLLESCSSPRNVKNQANQEFSMTFASSIDEPTKNLICSSFSFKDIVKLVDKKQSILGDKKIQINFEGFKIDSSAIPVKLLTNMYEYSASRQVGAQYWDSNLTFEQKERLLSRNHFHLTPNQSLPNSTEISEGIGKRTVKRVNCFARIQVLDGNKVIMSKDLNGVSTIVLDDRFDRPYYSGNSIGNSGNTIKAYVIGGDQLSQKTIPNRYFDNSEIYRDAYSLSIKDLKGKFTRFIKEHL